MVKNDDGTYARGYKLATLRTLLDSAGLLTQVALSAIQVHDMAACRPLLTQAPMLRAGDLLLEDRGSLLLDSGVFTDQQLNECTQQCFASLADVVHKLETLLLDSRVVACEDVVY